MSKARRLELALADDQVARDEARAAGETSYTRSCLVIELFDLVYASRSRGAPTSLMMCVHSPHCVCCVWAALPVVACFRVCGGSGGFAAANCVVGDLHTPTELLARVQFGVCGAQLSFSRV